MSTKGIYSAVSGAMAQSQRMDTIANNLANVNTTGFKKDTQVFKEYLAAYEKDPAVITIPRVTASIESFYDMAGGDSGYVDNQGTFTDFSQGSLKASGNQFDVAIEGDGLFEVATPQGIRMTRNGAFKIDNQGKLVTKDGFPVLLEGQEGSDPNSRMVQLNAEQIASGRFGVSGDGGIFVGPAQLGKFSIINVSDKRALHKVGGSLYALKPNFNAKKIPSENFKTHQGFLENSNVNIVQEMTDMISTTRAFESTQKAIQAFDNMNDKLVNSIPALR